jgi:uncharacterized protein (DUF2062 family)
MKSISVVFIIKEVSINIANSTTISVTLETGKLISHDNTDKIIALHTSAQWVHKELEPTGVHLLKQFAATTCPQ